MIKDLVVNLTQLPMKSVILDGVVADITPKFGMLLSRSWAKKVGGTLQMDLSYATIPIFGGENLLFLEEKIGVWIGNYNMIILSQMIRTQEIIHFMLYKKIWGLVCYISVMTIQVSCYK